MAEVWEEGCIIPQGLVIELENMIYQSLNRSMDKISWEEIQQSVYFKTMQKLGEEKWHPDMAESFNMRENFIIFFYRTITA